MLKHIVYWKVCENGTEEDRKKVVEGFRKKTEYLQSIIPQIKEARVGYNVNGGDVFHVCIDSVFNNLEELDQYINHPEHLKVREYMNSVSYDKAVFDYEF